MIKFVKNILSIILVISILTLPVTSFATDPVLGEYDNPYMLSTASLNFTMTIKSEETAWVKVDDCIGSTLNIDWASGAEYFVMYCMQPNYPQTNADNSLSLTMVNGADMFSVYNSGTESIDLRMSLVAGSGVIEQGTVDNPELVTMTTNMFGGLGASLTKELSASNTGYYYKTVAPADGIISVSVSANDAEFNPIGWTYFVNNATAGIYGDTHWSDEAEPVFYEDINVSADDTVIVFASTYDPANQWNNPEGTLSVNFSFTAVGSMGYPEEIVAGEYAPYLASGSNGYHYTWTAPSAGEVTVSMADDNENGWQYCVNVEKADGTSKYGDIHWCDDDPVINSESFAVSAEDKVGVFINTYDPANEFVTPEGVVGWTLSFVAGEGGEDPDPTPDPDPEPDPGPVDPPSEDDTYENSDVLLELGTKDYPLLDGYGYTIFSFEPSDIGKYNFTSTNALIGIVSYNGMWVTVAPSDQTITENNFVWECTDVGQTIWVAAKYNPLTRTIDDGKSVTISITREDLVIDTMPWTTYINTHKPSAFTFNGDADKLEPVEVFDSFVNKPVMGTDGYYHLDSATGPILYVDLDDAMMNLVDAMSYGQVKDIIMDGDKIVAKIDYNEAFGEYADSADKTLMLYPLTDDLIAIYKGTGHFQGWYGESGWLGTTADDGYLFACYFINDGTVNNNGNNNNNNNNNNNIFNPNAPSFGDNTSNNGKPLGNGNNNFGSTPQSGKPVTGTQTGKPVTGKPTIGAAQTSDPFILNLAVLAISGLGLAVTTRKSKKR